MHFLKLIDISVWFVLGFITTLYILKNKSKEEQMATWKVWMISLLVGVVLGGTRYCLGVAVKNNMITNMMDKIKPSKDAKIETDLKTET